MILAELIWSPLQWMHLKLVYGFEAWEIGRCAMDVVI